MEENKLNSDLKENYFNLKKIPKEYLLKKINVEKFPKLKKNLDSFFNDANKYFQTKYNDKYLLLDIRNINDKNKTSSLFLEDYNNKNNKLLLYRNNKSSVDTTNKSISNKTNISRKIKIKRDKKKFISVDENQLKHGQRYIDDKELDNIYQIFKELHKLNKNKTNNFITFKELYSNKNNISLDQSKGPKILTYDNNRTTTNFHKNDLIKIKDNKENSSNKYRTLTSNNGIKFNLTFNENNINNNKILKKNKNKSLNEIDYYKSSSTEFTQVYKYKNKIKNKKFLLKINNQLMIKDIKERNKLIKMQNQYIPSELCNITQKEIAKNLALQEKAFLNHSRNKKYEFKLNNYLSHKLKKSKKKLLLFEEENYRPNIETIIKLNNLQNKLNPEKIYNWTQDIHSSEYNINNQILSSEETIRNPQKMKIFSPLKNKILENSEYITRKIPLKQLKNLKKNLGNISKNYESLFINGVNLLKLESDISKKLRRKKILNNFESLISPDNLKSNDIYYHINSKMQNIK